jgi:hypothetical protein
MTLHWYGGAHTRLKAARRTQGQHDNGNDLAVIDLVRELATVCNDAAIVAILNRLRYRTGAGNTWTESRVQHLRHTNQIPACPPAGERPSLTMTQAAEQLKVSSMVIRRLIAQKILPARQIIKHAPWVIERKALDLDVIRKGNLVGARGNPEIDAAGGSGITLCGCIVSVKLDWTSRRLSGGSAARSTQLDSGRVR